MIDRCGFPHSSHHNANPEALSLCHGHTACLEASTPFDPLLSNSNNNKTTSHAPTQNGIVVLLIATPRKGQQAKTRRLCRRRPETSGQEPASVVALQTHQEHEEQGRRFLGLKGGNSFVGFSAGLSGFKIGLRFVLGG